MAEDKSITEYESRDGQKIKLSFSIVKNYLVQGNRDAVTPQELMYFLGVCKSRGLNPFKKDAYLIKYGTDPAAIITSIDYFRSRAKAQKDCNGWDRGVIVQKPDGSLKDSHGLVLEDEKIVGGFFEATPAGWTKKFRLEVNLSGYIKKTKDGRITQFWQQDKQPTMIAKVAESQGLRTLWPDEFQGIYEESEIQPLDDIELQKAGDGSYQIPDSESLDTSKFDKLAAKEIDYPGDKTLDKFLELTAQAQGMSIDQLKVSATKDPRTFESFWVAFELWRKKNYPDEKFICDICGFEAKSEQGLKRHNTQQHPPDKQDDPGSSQDMLDDGQKEQIENDINGFNEQAEKEAKIKAIREGYADHVIPVQEELNIMTYQLEDLELDMVALVLEKCKERAEETPF